MVDAFVMLEDNVIEFLRQFGTTIYVDNGDGPVEGFIVNGTCYVSTPEENKYLIKQLPRI